MKYRVERHRDDRNMITIHVDLDLLLFIPRSTREWSRNREDECFDGDEDVPNFVKRLLLIKGVVHITYDRYSLEVIKGDFFSWRSILPAVIKDLELVLNKGVPMDMVVRHRTPRVKTIKVAN